MKKVQWVVYVWQADVVDMGDGDVFGPYKTLQRAGEVEASIERWVEKYGDPDIMVTSRPIVSYPTMGGVWERLRESFGEREVE